MIEIDTSLTVIWTRAESEKSHFLCARKVKLRSETLTHTHQLHTHDKRRRCVSEVQDGDLGLRPLLRETEMESVLITVSSVLLVSLRL